MTQSFGPHAAPDAGTRAKGRRGTGWLWSVLLDRAPRLLALLLALQAIRVFEDYWWEETYRVVYAAMGVAGATELLIARFALLRLGIQALGIVAATVVYTPFVWYGWPSSWRNVQEVAAFVRLHAEQLHPFFAIALMTLLAARFIALWATGRRHVLAAVLTVIVLLAAVDSFFPFRLWSNVAWTVAIGLVWLVLLHFRYLRDRHYESWEALTERPLELVLPAALVIGAVVLIGVSMPRAPVLLEDPFTLLMRAQGREVPASKGEAGVLWGLSLTLPAGESQSGYSRNDAEIGGSFRYDFSPVMQVTTTHRSYWRGESKTVYTGKGWEDLPQAGHEQSLPVGAQNVDLPLSQPRDFARTETVEQSVVLLRDEPLPVLFGAGPITSLERVESEERAELVWRPDEWELVLSRPARVKAYSLVSETLVLDEEALRRASARPGDGRSDALAPYLQLPDSLPARVRQLAQEVVAGADNDYDRAKRLETYLKETYPYTNTPDVSRQRSRDVVDAFLFEIREGYCDYFSTAFVVMARSVGLPARWVKGYATGYDPVEEERMRLTLGGYRPDPVGAGTYIVRNADAHSWAEVYFEGFGWVPFEPTAGFTMPLRHAAEEAESVSLPEAGELPDVSAAGGATSGSGWAAALAAVAGAALLAAAGWSGWRNRERLAALWRWLRDRGRTPNERIVLETHRLVRSMHRKGFRRERHETMREAFARWSSSARDISAELEQVLLRFEAARYGPADGDEESYREFVELVNKIRKAI